MDERKRIQEWLLETVRLMVDCPADVTVQALEGEGISLRVRVRHDDIGKLIGKTGRTARALRTIGTAIAMAHGTRFGLDITDSR